MKKLFATLAILLFTSSLVLAQSDEEKATILKVGDNLPSFNFELTKGKINNISDYKGKLILINLFATWCPPCNEELPVMQKDIWDKYKDNKNFALFVFGREEGWEKLNNFKVQKGFTFPILPDVDRSIFSKFAKSFIPRNFLIDENGKIIYESVGYSPDEFKKLEDVIAAHLNK
ncbi:TlpA family protein disulfide reductase [Rhizosphaericola mali]|uniref:TlpA family protein disulfide reductase n=1 Tax=Rhizosphaericola mali TaxID=2545455 RepID=A0A5P2G9K0_9BACT|nr:TlpA disulfide reductase family protein [Rhizosphaericola mali]QES88201.1 TlpA family protein disulfide reductase [Rhizosphaericola mali]